MRRNRFHTCWVICVGMVLLASACGREERLVVYADPWMDPFPEVALEAFGEAHPEIELELRVLSSEVIAQHLHFGQPIDVFLCFRPEIMRDRGLIGEIAEAVPLADVDMVLAGTNPQSRQTALGADDCWVVAASDRPLRWFTEDWVKLPRDSCILYADFCRQTQDYLLRGWAAGGYVPGFFARKHPERLTILEQGPNYAGAFTAIRLLEAPHPLQADLFMDFLQTEKCKSLLVQENIIP